MKPTSFARFLLAATCWLAVGVVTPILGQEKMEALVKFERQSIQAQQTPDFKISNVKDKRWKPKDWLEIELPFKIEAPKGKKDAEFYDQLTVDFYVYLEPVPGSAVTKPQILTAKITHVNVPVHEEVATVVYLSPGTLMRYTGKKGGRVDASLVKQLGVEIRSGDTLVGFFSTTGNSPTGGGRFWESEKAEKVGGLLKDKSQTPFAPLWGDYHAEVQGAPGAR